MIGAEREMNDMYDRF